MINSQERRKNILKLLSEKTEPVSGSALAKASGVSRQVIVQDIALLRVEGHDIISTNYGYLLNRSERLERVFKVRHSDEDTEKELSIIVDLGGHVKDVFVYHKAYGVIRAEMPIQSRRDIQKLVDDIRSGKSTLLKNVTSGYHYHTVTAEQTVILDEIQSVLEAQGFLAPLQDYEPVDFGHQN